MMKLREFLLEKAGHLEESKEQRSRRKMGGNNA
jgi:hypothetical protein